MDGAGRTREVSARNVIWEMLTFLEEGWRYPLWELIDEITARGESDFDFDFERSMLAAVTAQLWVRSGAANTNVFSPPTLALVRNTHPVWSCHRPGKPRRLSLPRAVVAGRDRLKQSAV